MTSNSIRIIASLFLPCLLLMGCYKDYTNYYPDDEEPGLAIFSNKSNNLMTCSIDGKPWRTESRITSFLSRTNYEVYISRQVTASLTDTLTFSWTGYYSADKNVVGYISLVLPVAKSFSFRDLSSFQGQRININTTNGYFSTYIGGLNNNDTKGSGNIYFHSARFDSIAPGTYSGIMSGLFEADFNSFKIAKGRFDHGITPEQVAF